MGVRGGAGLTFSFFEPTGTSGQNAGETPHYTMYDKNFSNGVSAGQVDRVWSKLGTIEGGGSAFTVNVASLTDSDGGSVDMDKVDVILFENLSDLNAAVAKLSPNATGGMTDFIDASGGTTPTGFMRVKKGAKFMITDANIDTTTGSKLDIANVDSAALLTYRIRVAGRSSG